MVQAISPIHTVIDQAESRPLLAVRDLSVEFTTSRGRVRAVDQVSWSVAPGEITAIVGESGCGKSATAMALIRLLPKGVGTIVGGAVEFDGCDLVTLRDSEMRTLRGGSIGMIFQEPMTSLNPAHRIGDQIMETLFVHRTISRESARARAIELLQMVGIGDGASRLTQYPHQLSGGMRQRVLIAMALACDPKLLIADEPTTALDVTIQAQILELLRDLVRRLGISLVLITHNLGIVARYVDRVHVMYAGKIVESGSVDQIFNAPRHPYTLGLMSSVPRLDQRVARLSTIEGLPPDLGNLPPGCRFAPRCPMRTGACEALPELGTVGPGHVAACWHSDRVDPAAARPPGPAPMPTTDAEAAPLLTVDGLSRNFVLSKAMIVRAVQDVSFAVPRGQTLGLVGESGCGKSTIGRAVVGLVQPSEGRIVFDGEVIADASRGQTRPHWQDIQTVFQDPYSSLNPRMTVRQILAEPIRVHRLLPDSSRASLEARVQDLLRLTGLRPEIAARFPHQLSGGQRQRVCIARALAHNPRFIVLDEPVSALDVSVQGQIVNLLDDLQRQLGLSYLFISHDLAVVRHLSHRVVVMYLGRIMESAGSDPLYREPLHPYTRALLEAVPVADPGIERNRDTVPLGGELPSPLKPPSGCVFRTRCPLAGPECAAEIPRLREVRPGRHVACIKV